MQFIQTMALLCALLPDASQKPECPIKMVKCLMDFGCTNKDPKNCPTDLKEVDIWACWTKLYAK